MRIYYMLAVLLGFNQPTQRHWPMVKLRPYTIYNIINHRRPKQSWGVSNLREFR